MAKKKTKVDKEAELKAQQCEAPPGFKEVGDHWEEMFVFDKDHLEVEGVFLGTAVHIGENDSSVHILNIDGVRTGIWGSTLLDNRMKVVDEGDYIMIRYIGRETSRQGREYKDFKVFVREGTLGKESPVKEGDIPF